MDTSSVSDESSGIFSDAVNIPSCGMQYGSVNYSVNASTVGGEYSSENSQLGMLVGDGIVLSPNEAQMFKKIQKIIAENKNLKKALVMNSERLQNHVNDCIQWKDNHKNREDGLKDQLKREIQKTSQLEKRLEFLNTAMSTASMSMNSSTPSHSIEFLIAELNKQSKMLTDILHSSHEAFQSNDGALIKQAYEACITSISEFVSGRNQVHLDNSLSTVQQFCLPLQSTEGKILRDAITSIQNASKDYQRAVHCVQGGQQVPLSQHVQLKDQFDKISEEKEQVKNQLKTYVNQCEEKEKMITVITKQRDQLQTDLSEKTSLINKLTDDLENCRSVEILDFTPQQQPREIKQLEANIESYKKTIHHLKDQNETLNNDLSETMTEFEKAEDQNCTLREQVEQLQEEIEKLNLAKTPDKDKQLADNDNSHEKLRLLSETVKLQEADLENAKGEINDRIADELANKATIKQLTEKLSGKEQEVKHMEDELKCQHINFETKNRVQKNRESKDADRINNLLKTIEELKTEIQSTKTENEGLRQHIESYNSVLQEQNLTQKQDFATLINKSEELMSMSDQSQQNDAGDAIYENVTLNDSYTQGLLAENAKLLETAESHRLNVELMQEKIEQLTKEYQEVCHSLANLQNENEELQKSLHLEAQKNMKLVQGNKQFEEQLIGAREELNRSQQHASSSISRKDYDELREEFSAQQKVWKKEHQQMWNTVQLKVKNIKDLEEKINELTTELVGAKELIGEFRDKERASDDMVAGLREQEKKSNIEMAKLREQFDDVGLLRMQLDVYKNDFQAERESREKQQATLLEVQERLQQLQLENHHLKEELQKKGNIGLNSIRQRHGQWPNNPQPMDPRQSYGQQMRPQGGEHVAHWQTQAQGNNSEQWQVYGRGSEQIHDQRRQQRPSVSNNRMDEDEQRKCPKCQTVLPDLDSLQIHVMECLDK